jgi:hypothetical protein
MMTDAERRNLTFGRLRTDVVTKPDGRYLVYYTWPTADGATAEPADSDVYEQPVSAAGANEATRSPTRPWISEGGPPDEAEDTDDV